MPVAVTTTTQAVVNRLNTIFGDTTNAQFSEDEKAAFIGMAVGDAWPLIKNVTTTSITVAAGTLTYTPSTLGLLPEWGYSLAYVDTPLGEKDYIRALRQRLEVGNWYILMPDYLSRLYDGKTMYFQYNSAYTITEEIGTAEIALPLDYLWKSAAYFFCLATLRKAPNFDTKPYEQLTVLYKDMAEKAKQAFRRGDMPHMIPIVAEAGAGEVSGYNPNGIYRV